MYKSELSPINFIDETNFHRAWQRAISLILDEGCERTIGGPTEKDPEKIQRKYIKDSCQLIALTGPAISQIRNREMHPKFPFGPKQLQLYCEQFTREYVRYWQGLPDGDDHKFKYIYLERLVSPYDQIKALSENLAILIKNSVSSNRVQSITWRPNQDAFNDEPPCLQRIQLFYLGDGKVDIRADWRSRDILAWQSNIICLTAMLYREVLTPNQCELERWVDKSDSLHVYTDKDRLQQAHEAANWNKVGGKYLY